MEAQTVTTIVCRQCHAELDVSAVVCYDCGTSTNEDEPLKTQTIDKQRLLDRPWFLFILVLHVGFLGIPAYWKTNYSVTTRLFIVAASIVYTVVAVAIIIWWLMQLARYFN